MAESVDALVSNTSGFTAIPVRPRVWVLKKAVDRLIDSLSYFVGYKQRHYLSLYIMPSITFSIESGFSTIRNTESESNLLCSI